MLTTATVHAHLPLWLEVQRFEAAQTNCFFLSIPPVDDFFPLLAWTAKAPLGGWKGGMWIRTIMRSAGCRGIIGEKTDRGPILVAVDCVCGFTQYVVVRTSSVLGTTVDASQICTHLSLPPSMFLCGRSAHHLLSWCAIPRPRRRLV